ncbi:serine protease [Ophiostoma piceae UAMH 11346]|uniref:Serine protease n=1 Tax=Ophiostoma piceae (strain UAMH 11346) TaxID=1262450 RepID=S3BYU6_OPHP1|nr:serine protease [Ophiostoma piceae UAMH 11346]
MQHKLALLSLLPLALAAPTAVLKRDQPAPVLRPRGANLVEGKYIVKLREGVTLSTAGIQDSVTSSLSTDSLEDIADYVYGGAGGFHGFALTLDDATLESLRQNPDVDYIEQDAVVSVSAYTTQKSAPWGISRLSHKTKGSTDYVYDASAGEGTCAYIIDTGIYVGHKEFGGRATWLNNFSGDGDNTDGNGHGTHVAGTIGSSAYGVAKKTKLFAVKVLDGNGQGTNSGVIAGINYVAGEAPKRTSQCPKGSVANMSLGGGTSSAVNKAAAALIDAGVFLAVAAGNESEDAKNSSPASEPSVCTVGATDSSDTLAEYSNFGSIVDILAPGTDILSTWIGSSTAKNTISGTSMATPHVAGLGAYLLGLGNVSSDPEALCAYIASSGLSGKISSVPSGTVNKLAFNGNPSA